MDKVQKIREEVERLFNHVKDSNFESDSGAFYYLKDLLDFIDSLQEEPVSENLEDASEKCDIQTEKEAEIEYDFVMGIIKNEHRLPTFDDAIKYGMRLKEKEIQSTIELAEDHAMPEDERRNGMKLSN